MAATSYRIKGHIEVSYTFIAGTGGVTAGLFGSIDANGTVVVANGTTATNIIGIIDQTKLAGATVRVYSGYVEAYMTSGGAFAAGAHLECDAAGKADDTALSANVGYIGVAMEAATGADEYPHCIFNLPAFG